MERIGGHAATTQRDAEEDFVQRIGEGMTGFGQQGHRPGHQAGDQLRAGDDQVGRQCYDDDPNAAALGGTPKRGS